MGSLRAFWNVPTYRFAVLFLAYLAAISLSYPALRVRFAPALDAAEVFTAELVYTLMGFFTSDVAIRLDRAKAVYLGPFPVFIVEECSGLYEALLLSAALLAFPTTWTRTLLGFLIGFPMIYAMNILRIAMLLVAGRFFPHSFEFLHIYFWQVTMIAMVASTWLVWVIWVVRGYEGPEATRGASP